MADPFLGEIRMFAGNYVPEHWAGCDGTLLPIAQHSALFSLLGTIYDGDGETTFGLPDLRGRVPIHYGPGPGLPARSLGARGGAETVTLNTNQLPSHSHQLAGSSQTADETNPGGNLLAGGADVYLNETPNVNMNAAAIAGAGNTQAHNNMQPFLCVSFIIALMGTFPLSP